MVKKYAVVDKTEVINLMKIQIILETLAIFKASINSMNFLFDAPLEVILYKFSNN